MSDYLTVANANSTFATKTQLNNYYTKTQSDARYARVVINSFSFSEEGYVSRTTKSFYAPTTGYGATGDISLKAIYNTNNYNSLLVQAKNNPPRLLEIFSGISSVTTTGYSITPILNQNTGAIKQIELNISGSFQINGSNSGNLIQTSHFRISAFGVEAIQLEN